MEELLFYEPTREFSLLGRQGLINSIKALLIEKLMLEKIAYELKSVPEELNIGSK